MPAQVLDSRKNNQSKQSHEFASHLLVKEWAMVESAQLEPSIEAVSAPAYEHSPAATTRLVSLDAFRGLVMVLMLGEVMRLPQVAQAFPHSLFWRVIGFNTEHVEWQGCSLHDLIQPAFSFLVGAALPFSIASRKRKGQTFWQMVGHAAWRALLLIILGIVLRSLHSRSWPASRSSQRDSSLRFAVLSGGRAS